jgi:hypothetical protein
VDEVECFTPNLLRNWVNFAEIKVGPLSKIISIGRPK